MDQERSRETDCSVRDLIKLFESKETMIGCSPAYWLDEIMIEAEEGNTEAMNYLNKITRNNTGNAVDLEIIQKFLNIFFTKERELFLVKN